MSNNTFLENYYNDYDEEGRLENRIGKVEYLTTRRYLDPLLTSDCKIAEIGAGTGRADLILQYPRKGLVAIFEFKCADSEEEMNDKCDEALEQIEKREYSFPFRRKTVYKYGVAFFQKQCLVKKA